MASAAEARPGTLRGPVTPPVPITGSAMIAAIVRADLADPELDVVEVVGGHPAVSGTSDSVP